VYECKPLVWGSAEVGSVFFIAGGFMEISHNRCWNVVGRCRSTLSNPR